MNEIDGDGVSKDMKGMQEFAVSAVAAGAACVSVAQGIATAREAIMEAVGDWGEKTGDFLDAVAQAFRPFYIMAMRTELEGWLTDHRVPAGLAYRISEWVPERVLEWLDGRIIGKENGDVS